MYMNTRQTSTMIMYGIMPAKIWLSVTCFGDTPLRYKADIATGGDRKAAWRLTATMVPKRIGSIWKWLSRGMKIGQKMTMISVHSSGQPSRKMMSWAMNWKPIGDRFMLSTHRSITDWPPWSAKTAENSAEPTKSQQTMAVVLAVRKVDCFRFWRSSGDVRRYQSPGTSVPSSVPPMEPATRSDAQSSPSYQPSANPMAKPTRDHHHTGRA